jgi:hypothetical protein
MNRTWRSAVGLAAIVVVLVAGRADAREDRAPARFFGVVPASTPTSAQLARIQRAGVRSIRAPLNWSQVEPVPGVFDWSSFDAVLLPASEHDIQVLPFLLSSPDWAATNSAVLPVDTPAQRDAWTAFLGAAVHRYGPSGEFWQEHPTVRPQPIVTWQIWNEPNISEFATPPDPKRYASLVGLSSRVIRSLDPGAQILLGGMFASPSVRQLGAYRAANFLARMYKVRGFRSSFQGVALHPYARSYLKLTPLIVSLRRVMSRYGDARKSLWITEFGWSSDHPGEPFGKGLAGQAEQLSGAFRLLLANRRDWRLSGAYWFSLTDSEAPQACRFCGGSGLFSASFRAKPAWRSFSAFSAR